MFDLREWNWRFRGFETLGGDRVVQKWFDGLPEDAKEEFQDILGYLQRVANHLWQRPRFDQLEDRISEVRAKAQSGVYRMYGYFGPSRETYTFLHGTEKKVRNDAKGKRTAKDRLRQLERNEARTHEFEFED
jgi:phage-related protein